MAKNIFQFSVLSLLIFVGFIFFKISPSYGDEAKQRHPFHIMTQQGKVTYDVELAQSTEQKKQGLMFRKALKDHHGMLFVHKQPQILRMWMKNTFISLDMIFIDQFGTIRHIIENAPILNENTISSRYGVTSVLEINAGQVADKKINIGDRVIFGTLYRK